MGTDGPGKVTEKVVPREANQAWCHLRRKSVLVSLPAVEQDVLTNERWGRAISVPVQLSQLSAPPGRKSLYALRFSSPLGTKQFLKESYWKLRKMPAASQRSLNENFLLFAI